MLRDWDKRYPGRIETMFSAMQNVVPSHLCDTNLFDFKGITHGSEVVNGGDLAFDREEIPASHPAIPHKMFTLAPGNSTFHYFNNRTRHVFPLIFPPCNCFHAL